MVVCTSEEQGGRKEGQGVKKEVEGKENNSQVVRRRIKAERTLIMTMTISMGEKSV